MTGANRALIGDAFVLESQLIGLNFTLCICDPPYGKITNEKWDIADYPRWMQHCTAVAAPDATIAMWGGIGKPGHRPFLRFAVEVEIDFPDWTLDNWITWRKKRAYGVAHNYLWVREECLILRRGKPPFNIPLLDEKRGYAGYNAKYPAKSEYLRRTNVWSDVSELFRDKIHPTQKPDKLYDILVRTHTNEGDVVYDPCCGSGTTARAAVAAGRKYCVVEQNPAYLVTAGLIPRA